MTIFTLAQQDPYGDYASIDAHRPPIPEPRWVGAGLMLAVFLTVLWIRYMHRRNNNPPS